jgi:hypothetical protein
MKRRSREAKNPPQPAGGPGEGGSRETPAFRHSVAIQRLIDEVRLERESPGAASFDRAHNRHNRS